MGRRFYGHMCELPNKQTAVMIYRDAMVTWSQLATARHVATIHVAVRHAADSGMTHHGLWSGPQWGGVWWPRADMRQAAVLKACEYDGDPHRVCCDEYATCVDSERVALVHCCHKHFADVVHTQLHERVCNVDASAFVQQSHGTAKHMPCISPDCCRRISSEHISVASLSQACDCVRHWRQCELACHIPHGQWLWPNPHICK
jgi:hypothetical protein